MRQQIHQLYRHATEEALAAGPAKTPRSRWMDLVHTAVILVQEAGRDRLAVRASTLAYWSAVAMVPVMLLAFALTGPLGLADDARLALRTVLYRTFLANSVEEVGLLLDTLLEGTTLRTLGLLGVAGLIATGAQLYFNVERCYNDIFHVRIRRSRVLRFAVFYAGLTLGPLVLGWGVVNAAASGESGLRLYNALPGILTAGGLITAVRLLPNTEVSWRSAVVGGGLSAILFEAAKIGFGLYTDVFGARNSLARIYGSLAFLPFLLLWLYVVWLVVLIGVELAFVVQHHRRLLAAQRRAALGEGHEERQPDGAFALLLMVALAGAFDQGRGAVDADALALAMGADPHQILRALEVLEDAGLVVANGRGGYVPGRPPDRMLASEVLNAWRGRAAVLVAAEAPELAAVMGRLAAWEADLDVPLSALLGPTARDEADGHPSAAPVAG